VVSYVSMKAAASDLFYSRALFDVYAKGGSRAPEHANFTPVRVP